MIESGTSKIQRTPDEAVAHAHAVEILESIGDPLVAFDKQWCYTYVSRRAGKALGKAQNEMIGRSMWDLFPADLDTGFRDACRRAWAEENPVIVECYSNVLEAWLECSIHPFADGASAQWRDITRRKRAEEALRASVARERARATELEAIMEAAPVAIVISRDPESREVLGNGRTYEFFRLAPGSKLSADPLECEVPFRTLKDGREISRGELPVRKTSRTGRPVRNYEFDVVFEDGTCRNLLGNSVPLFGEDGRPRGAVGAFVDITERKRAEQRLRDSEARLRAVVDGTDDCVFLKDRERRVLLANPAVLRTFGKSSVIGKTDEEIFPDPAIAAATRAADERVVESGQTQTIEETIPTAEGPRVFLTRKTPWRDGTGRVIGLAGIARDITDRKQAEAALLREGEKLRQLNRTLRALSRSSQALLLATDEASYLQEVCNIIVEDCGHAMVWAGYREEDEAKTVRVAAHAGFDAGYLETLNITWADTERGCGPAGTAIRTGKVSVCHNILSDPAFLPWREEAARRGYTSAIALPLLDGGRAFAILTIYSREPDSFSEDEVKLLTELAGDFAYSINVLRLREAHARSEQSLRESEARFRSVVDSNIIGVVFSDPVSGKITDANDEYLRIIGRSREELLAGKLNWKEITVAGSLAYEERLPEMAVPGAVVPPYEKEYIRPDGSHVPVIIGGSFAVDPRLGVVAFVLDNSEHKRAEERLRQAQKLESVGLLAGGIAHDFNNLLTGIMGNASMLLDEIDGGPAERIRQLISSAERAAHLTRQLLAYSGKGQFIVRDLDISQVVHEMSDLVQFSIPNSVNLSVNLQKRLPLVCMDPSQLQQIVMNLVINAGEAIGEGSPGGITVSALMTDVDQAFVDATGQEVAPGRYVTIEVSDTGNGIDEENRAKIFDPFFTTKFTGRGLGLAAVAGIVRALRGGIMVESGQGRGSTFRVLLPVTEGRAHAREREPHASDRPTILVVDDEPSVLDFIGAVFRRRGYGVLTSSDGRDALAVCERHAAEIDLAIIDVVMPLMGAGDLLPALKAKHPGMKVLLTSGYSESEARRLCAGYPDAAFVQKPYTAQKIAAIAEGLLGISRNIL